MLGGDLTIRKNVLRARLLGARAAQVEWDAGHAGSQHALHWVFLCLGFPQATEVAYRKAERALEHERRAVESAEKAAATAEKKLEK